MNSSQRHKIISNKYADLIINRNESPHLMDIFPDTTVNDINQDLTILHFPVENINSSSISTLGYHTIPVCYGLLSIEDTTYWQPDFGQQPSTSDLQGSGVLIGLVDTGIDYQHQAFMNEDNTTRIVSIWDQSIESENYPSDFFYGTEYSRDQINEALANPHPLSLVPSTDTIGHGTMIAGVAAGTPDAAYNFSGTAPLADLVVVKLKEAKDYLKEFYVIPKEANSYQQTDIIMGIKYLEQVAQNLNRPLVILIALGSNKSDHAGRSFLSRYINELANSTGRALVIAAGNEGNRELHYYGDITPAHGEENVYLDVTSSEYGFTLQFWGSSPNYFWLDIYAPNGDFLSRLPPIHLNNVIIEYGDSIIITDTLLDEPYSTEQFIIMRFYYPLPGTWRFLVTAFTADIPRQFHMWLPLHNYDPEGTKFQNSNTYTTITDPANIEKLISVTAYDTANNNLYFNASRGFTLYNRPKPDIAAPGVNMICPYLGNQYVLSTATSLAAAYTAGVIATLLEWGIVENNIPNLNNMILLHALLLTAKRQPDLSYPNPDFGYGILSTDNIFNVLAQYSNNPIES
jgi:subtilisin family serine protease